MNRWMRSILAMMTAAGLSLMPCLQMASYAAEPQQKTVVEEEKENALFSGFTAATENDIKEKIEGGGMIRSAAYDAADRQYYVMFEDGSQYKIESTDSNFMNYLKVMGAEVQQLSVGQEAVRSESSSRIGQASLIFIMIGFLGIGIFMYSRSRKEKALATNSKEEERKSKIRAQNTGVRFEDVEGVDELKQDVFRIVDCLKNPEKYRAIGARIPKGIILYGPPGTGKTLLAKAIAGEAGVPFYTAVGSDFIEKYVGVGASRIRELYKTARKTSPCIVFIDEVDAIAGDRDAMNNQEYSATVNALLSELDGFDSSENVVTICATNHLESLDPAFQRSGRFDLKLAVGLPDRKARRRIIDIHGRNKKFSRDIDLDDLAVRTAGFSGADIEAILNESAVIAAGTNKPYITNQDIEDAFFKILMKGNKKKREKIHEVNRVVAWHESGHTLATKLLTRDSVPSVTIIGSSSGAGGVTFRVPDEEEQLKSRKDIENMIRVMYAGRAAEEIYYGDQDKITIGASQDIKQATSVIRDYLAVYGLGKGGMVDIAQFRPNDYSFILDEAREMAQRLYKETVDILAEQKETLRKIAETLLEKETLREWEIDDIIAGRTNPPSDRPGKRASLDSGAVEAVAYTMQKESVESVFLPFKGNA